MNLQASIGKDADLVDDLHQQLAPPVVGQVREPPPRLSAEPFDGVEPVRSAVRRDLRLGDPQLLTSAPRRAASSLSLPWTMSPCSRSSTTRSIRRRSSCLTFATCFWRCATADRSSTSVAPRRASYCSTPWRRTSGSRRAAAIVALTEPSISAAEK